MLHAGRAARVQHGGAAVHRGSYSRIRARLTGAALVLGALAAPTAAQTGLSPHGFARPYGTSPLDQEKARVYQDQLRHDLPREAPADATDAARQRELRRELDRVDRVLERRPPRAATIEPPVPDRGPVTASGGHPQPTPAEIEARMRERRPASPLPPPNPVYDLFGERLQ